ncbi:MAG: hypothetical protein IJG56_00080 [Clostridia bacterium]|nr:hypothetical protein [Clostridia bacterium]
MKVLFVGNSHTFFNDMPYMLRLLGAARGIDIDVVQNTSGGRGLDWQSNQFDVRFNILYGGYDFIVLQHIAHPFPGKENLIESAEKLIPYLDRSGSVPVLYMPWSEKNNPEGQAIIVEAHEALAKKYPALRMAPIGLVWDKVRNEHPEIELYYRDGEHAAPIGSYLIACTLLRTLTGASVKGLPSHLEMGKPTFAGLKLDKVLEQDFACATDYQLDEAACEVVQDAVETILK